MSSLQTSTASQSQRYGSLPPLTPPSFTIEAPARPLDEYLSQQLLRHLTNRTVACHNALCGPYRDQVTELEVTNTSPGMHKRPAMLVQQLVLAIAQHEFLLESVQCEQFFGRQMQFPVLGRAHSRMMERHDTDGKFYQDIYHRMLAHVQQHRSAEKP